MHSQHLVKNLLLTMKGETEVSDTARLSLFQQIVHHAIIHIAAIELFHASSDSVQQIVVEIIHLQLLQGVMIHLLCFVESPIVVVKVRQLGSHEILTALMTTESNTRTAFRLTLTINRRSVEIVHTMLNGVVNLLVDHFLIKLITVVHLRRQAHHAIT